jgi:hypothetical protein
MMLRLTVDTMLFSAVCAIGVLRIIAPKSRRPPSVP